MGHTPQGVAVLTAVLTRPSDTTAYAANDLIGRQTAVVPVNSPAIVNAVAMKGDAFRLDRVRLRKSSISLTNASFRVHIFDRLPTWTVGDNGAGGAIGALAVTDMAGHCGFVELTMDRASATAGAYGMGNPSSGSITVAPQADTTIYIAIQATAAYTPASAEVFTVDIEGIRP